MVTSQPCTDSKKSAKEILAGTIITDIAVFFLKRSIF